MTTVDGVYPNFESSILRVSILVVRACLIGWSLANIGGPVTNSSCFPMRHSNRLQSHPSISPSDPTLQQLECINHSLMCVVYAFGFAKENPSHPLIEAMMFLVAVSFELATIVKEQRLANDQRLFRRLRLLVLCAMLLHILVIWLLLLYPPMLFSILQHYRVHDYYHLIVGLIVLTSAYRMIPILCILFHLALNRKLT